MFKTRIIFKNYYFVIILLIIVLSYFLFYLFTERNKVQTLTDNFSIPIGIEDGQLDYIPFDKESFVPPRMPRIFLKDDKVGLFNPKSSTVNYFKEGKFDSSFKIKPENNYSVFGIDYIKNGYLTLEINNDLKSIFQSNNKGIQFIKWFFVNDNDKQELSVDPNIEIPNFLYTGNFKILDEKYIFLKQNNKYLEIDLQNKILKSATLNIDNLYTSKQKGLSISKSKNELKDLGDFVYKVTKNDESGNIQFEYDQVVDLYIANSKLYILSLNEKNNWNVNIKVL